MSLEEKLARVTYDAAVTNPQELADEIEELGFETMLPSVAASSGASKTCTIGIGGMTCHSCVSLIEDGLGEIAGVESAAVSLEKEQAVIVFNPSMASIEDFKTAIDDMGFIVKTPTGKCDFCCRKSNMIGRWYFSQKRRVMLWKMMMKFL